MPWKASTSLLSVLLFLLASCGEDQTLEDLKGGCSTPLAQALAGSTGAAMVFNPDPMSSSGDLTLPPTASNLNDHRQSVQLRFLGGRGVLEGRYVDVRNQLRCNGGFGAFSENNEFTYPHENDGFQEAMNYYHGTEYRALLDANGFLSPVGSMTILSNCILQDNAYYSRGTLNGEAVEFICLGESVETPNASYSDDGNVVVHELQHGATVNTYSQVNNLNQLFYDEAGALNEAVSDFVALMYFSDSVHPSLDSREFSRWALGSFFPSSNRSRGANFCPVYDSDYPNCSNYSIGASGFSANNNTVSYAYPDGLGWPHANNFIPPGYLRDIHLNERNQEEIHNTGMLLLGALWDIFEKVRENSNSSDAKSKLIRLVHQALSQLPQPNFQDHVSPVSFIGFASLLVQWASTVGLSSEDENDLVQVLTNRGLYAYASLPSGWATVGSGNPSSPGMKIIDSPSVLKYWIGIPPQAQGNNLLSPGDVAAVWFDVENTSDATAGGVNVDVEIVGGSASFVGYPYNRGVITSSRSQVTYYKVNGTAIVSQLSSTNQNFHVPTSNTYFKTNPYFSASPMTAFFVYVQPGASAGEKIQFRVTMTPTNGPSEVLNYEAVVTP